MKKSFLVIVALLMFIGTAGAQKIGYINTESILSEIPAYTAAQSQLEALSDKYKAQIETELGKIETLYQNYQASRNSMSASQRQNAENEIISKERVVQEKQRIYFGEDGIMAKKAEELLAPIRTRVDKAIADGLGVMDMTAFTLCKENDVPIVVFNINREGELRRVVEGENVGTVVSK